MHPDRMRVMFATSLPVACALAVVTILIRRSTSLSSGVPISLLLNSALVRLSHSHGHPLAMDMLLSHQSLLLCRSSEDLEVSKSGSQSQQRPNCDGLWEWCRPGPKIQPRDFLCEDRMLASIGFTKTWTGAVIDYHSTVTATSDIPWIARHDATSIHDAAT